MAYQTGSVTDMTNMLSILTTFAAANGWSWDATHAVINKGNVYGKLETLDVDRLKLTPGTGVDGTGVLTGTGDAYHIMSGLGTTGSWSKNITWPATYHIFLNTNPDDIVVLINFDNYYWTWMGFGQANNLGVPGLGTWFGAFMPVEWIAAITISEAGTSSGYNRQAPCAPFWAEINNAGYGCLASSSLHCNLDGADGVVRQWSSDGMYASTSLLGRFYDVTTPLLARQPNSWNGEDVLVPARIGVNRPSSLKSYAAEMPHVRLLRLINREGGDIITIGTDQWFVAPFFRKNTAAQTGTDSGTWGWAIRKTP